MRPRIAYQPGDSLLHRLHPLVKLAYLLVGTLFVFVIQNPWIIAGFLALTLIQFPASRLRLRGMRGSRIFVVTALMLAFLQVIFVDDGPALVDLGLLAPTIGGVQVGVYVAARFLSVIFLSYLFVLTTEPGDLAYALMRVGVPYRFGFALITAIRLVPMFEQEGQIIYNAQIMRGVRYDVRSPRRFLTLGRQFFLPLLVSALGKVDALAASMEGRCFGKYAERSFRRQTRFTRIDATAAATLVVAMIATGIAIVAR
jgi:energy-coupling factor transport system permease protein